MLIAVRRIVRRNTFANCPFSAAIERAERFLRNAVARKRIDELMVDTSAAFTVVEDYTDAVRRHDALEFSWRPRSKMLPSGQALLTVRPHAPQGSELQFSISYQPPFGAFGRIFDAAVGRHVAWVTCGRLLRRLRREVERP